MNLRSSLLGTGPILFGLGLLLALGTLAGAAPPAYAQGVYGSGLFELGDGQPPPGTPGTADVLGSADQAGPDWADLFDATGKLRDDYPYDGDGNPLGNGVPDYLELYGGTWAFFADDYVSKGVDFEGDALTAEGGVVNSVVQADHDIGDAHVYATADANGNLVLYMAAERLGSGDSSLEFEFNQGLFRVGRGGFGIGAPWEVLGARAGGDFLVRVTFGGGVVTGAAAGVWDGSTWLLLSSLAGEGCDGTETLCAIANGVAIEGGAWTEGPIEAGRLIEIGVNAGALLGTQPVFTTVRIRTPEDIAFGYFGKGN
jgi:hypothetical protein